MGLLLHCADDDKIMQAAEEARKKKQAVEQAKQQAEQDNESNWGSMPGQLVAALTVRQQQKKRGKKAMFAEAEGDGDVQVSVKPGGAGKVGCHAYAAGGWMHCTKKRWLPALFRHCSMSHGSHHNICFKSQLSPHQYPRLAAKVPAHVPPALCACLAGSQCQREGCVLHGPRGCCG